MTNLFAKHEPYWDTGHLGEVLEDMRTQGAPTLRAVKHKNNIFATEGSHRIASAHHLGLTPKIVLEEPEDHLDTSPFWDKVATRLPRYIFDHLLVLDLSSFKEKLE